MENNARVTLNSRVKTIFDLSHVDFTNEKHREICLTEEETTGDRDDVERMATERKQAASSNRCRA